MKLVLTLIAACLIFVANGLSATPRYWEQWDKDDVSQIIDTYWLASKDEIEHRKALAVLTKQWALPYDRFLEIGCGSGLVYNQLVPAILPNSSYVGVDISENMLDIATKRYPEGIFIKDDLYALSFADNSFEIVAAFEVFGHIGDIEKPIMEMFRTTSRLMIFTVWSGDKTKIGQEVINHTAFIHMTYSQEDIMKAIDNALKDKPHTVYTQPLSEDKIAYIIRKG